MTDTKQINVRLPVELHKALADHKVRTGEDKSDVIRRGIESILGIPETYRATDLVERVVRDPRPTGPKPETIELAAWLAGRLGMPRALMRQRIFHGRVTVDGEVFKGDRLEKARIGDVALDGKHVKPPKSQNGQ